MNMSSKLTNLLNDRNLLLIFLGALLYGLSFPPFNLTYGSFVAFIPLYKIVSENPTASKQRWYFFFFGLFAAIIAVHWIYFNVGAPPLTRFISGTLLLIAEGGFQVLVALGLLLCRKLFKEKTIWLLPLFYLGVEQFKIYEELAFPWITVYNSIVNADTLIQFADIGGANFLTLFILYTNLFLFKGYQSLKRKESFRNVFKRVLPAFILLLGFHFYGVYRIHDLSGDNSAGKTANIALIHANLGAKEKWERKNFSRIVSDQIDLSEQAAKQKPDLIVWGESNFPGYLQNYPGYYKFFNNFAQRWRTNLLIGSLGFEFKGEKEDKYNSAFYFAKDGQASRYDKILLVPFGEVFPFSYLFPILKDISLGQSNFSRGAKQKIFSLKNDAKKSLLFAVNICYEGIFSYLNAGFVKSGADILVNISNDAWYGNSAEIYQHNMYNRFRAIENRTPVIRLANKAQNFVFNPDGSFKKMFDSDKEVMHIEKITTSNRISFFTRNYQILRKFYTLVPILLLLAGFFYRFWIKLKR